MTQALLKTTALLEAATGLALLVVPPIPAHLLLGTSFDAGGAVIARVAGAALLSLAVACFSAVKLRFSAASMSLLPALFVYNLSVMAVLAWARLGAGLSGIALWPAVGLHAGMAVWCLARFGK